MMVRFDSTRLQRLGQALAKAERLSFDGKIPRHLQREDYAERAQRKAAVCVALCNVDDEASLLLTERSHAVGTHAGQVSFPGGHIDENETAEQAAIRELKEETGLEAQPINRWHDIRAVTGTMVTPVFCIIGEELNAERIADVSKFSVEVEQAFSVRVEDLIKPSNRKVKVYEGRWTMATFQVEEFPLIWGLTAAIIDGTLAEFICPVLDLPYTSEEFQKLKNTGLG